MGLLVYLQRSSGLGEQGRADEGPREGESERDACTGAPLLTAPHDATCVM